MKSKQHRYKEQIHQNENSKNQRQKQSEEKKKYIFKGATKIPIADFSTKAMEDRRYWHDIGKALKRK